MGIEIREIFLLSGGEKIPCQWVLPEEGCFTGACCLFWHPATGDHRTFLKEARQYAEAGVMSFVFDTPYAASRNLELENAMDIQWTLSCYEQILREMQIALQFLQAQELYPIREWIFIGQNLGAALSGLLTQGRFPFRTFILRAGVPQLSHFWLESEHPVAQRVREKTPRRELREYVTMIKSYDLLNYSRFFLGKRVLLQYGKQDSWMLSSEVEAFYKELPNEKKLVWYAEGHGFSKSSKHIQDALFWMSQHSMDIELINDSASIKGP